MAPKGSTRRASRPTRRASVGPGALGIAVKIDDGAERGYQPVVVSVLENLGAFPGGVPASLAAFHRIPVQNTQQKLVGSIHSVFEWPA